MSVFAPFFERIHPADKLLDDGYLDRHFQKIGYADKAALIRRLYSALGNDQVFNALPTHLKQTVWNIRESWEPISPEEIRFSITMLPKLRSIPQYYLRNFSVSIMQDAIRLQFNCDGTHIVSRKDFTRFLEENLE